MKKLLTLLLITFLTVSIANATFASEVLQVNTFGSPEITGNNGHLNINVSFSTQNVLNGTSGNWTLSVLPINNNIFNTQYSDIKLPLNNLTIYNNGKAENFSYNRGIVLERGNSAGYFTKSYQLKLLMNKAFKPGEYTTALQFVLQSGTNQETYLYNVSFQQNPVEQIEVLPSYLIQQDMNQTALMMKGNDLDLSIPTKIIIKSNKNWLLKANNLGFQETSTKETSQPKIFFKVSTLQKGISSKYTIYTPLVKNSSFIVAKGEPTINSQGIVEPKTIEIKYKISAKDKKSYIEAGRYLFDIDYEIFTEE